MVRSLDADRHVEQAKKDNQTDQPTNEQVQQAGAKVIQEAVKPLYDPALRNLLIELKKRDEQTIDNVSQDKVIEAAFSADALERAKGIVQSFEKFIQDHKDEITALQILITTLQAASPVRRHQRTGEHHPKTSAPLDRVPTLVGQRRPR